MSDQQDKKQMKQDLSPAENKLAQALSWRIKEYELKAILAAYQGSPAEKKFAPNASVADQGG